MKADLKIHTGMTIQSPAPDAGTVRGHERIAEQIAHLLDDAIHIPATGLRFGIDPLIGMVPLIGDFLATLFGVSIVFVAHRLGVTWSVLLKMVKNLAINGLLGAIPILGDVASFWFKAHSKNATLLIRAVSQKDNVLCAIKPPPSNARVFAIMGLVIVLLVTLIAYVSWWFWTSKSRRFF